MMYPSRVRFIKSSYQVFNAKLIRYDKKEPIRIVGGNEEVVARDEILQQGERFFVSKLP